jgi:hypothetical protein
VDLFGLFVIAAISEAVWETIKMTWQQGKASTDRIGSLSVGLIVAFATGLDVLKLVNVPVKIPFIGIILTGILISRGSNFVHDVFSSVNNMHTNTKPSSGDSSLQKK